ncbi:MAG: ribosome biogenesis GTPase Der [Clostridiales bacterium]|nr:ribosome biogenesis GTPase Der [Clostridiales bacterium]
MARPLVAVVGRPNVGKSTFFNKMSGKRIAIVEDTPGVTRDRVYADCEWLTHKFTLIDTGGIDPHSDDPLLKQMRRQSEIAIETADVIVFFTDGKQGVTADDETVADMLRRSGKPVVLAVNKIDSPKQLADVNDFYSLGMGEPIGVSSLNLLNLGDLLDEIVSHFPEEEAEDEEDAAISIAVVGKPNVGKSSLVNRILGEERVMVSDIAGTTRDAVDTRFKDGDDEYVIIDTAGIRRKRAIEYQSLERFSVVRSFAAIDRCDVALLLIDAKEGISEQDTKIAGYIDEAGKPAIIVINKWDALEKETNTLDKFTKDVREKLKFMEYAPIISISALTGQRVNRILEMVKSVYAQASRRITTGLLNDILQDAQQAMQPPATSGRRLKIYYATQSVTNPPTFVLFVNDETLMHFSYQRFLENRFRQAFGFDGTPIRFVLRERGKDEEN